MRKNFVTGLILLVPTVLTFFILSLLVNILTAPFIGIVSSFITYFVPGHVDAIFENNCVKIITKLLVLLLLLAAITITGMLARMVFFNAFLNVVDAIAHAIPGFKHIYKSIRETVHTLVGSQKSPFSSVVFVPFPHDKAYCLGLISSEQTDTKAIVYIPLAMNLTYGMLVRYDRNRLIHIDMPFESAIKTAVSCGAVFPDFKVVTKNPNS